MPYGGNVSCDMDVLVASRGSAVSFRLDADGVQTRGVVLSIRPACRSGLLDDGGNAVHIRVERFDATWIDTGLRVLYAHLDPVAVRVGDALDSANTLVGRLGPGEAQSWPQGSAVCGTAHGADDPRREEYHSRCCGHSHLHVEGFGAASVLGRGTRVAPRTEVLTFPLAARPAVAPTTAATTTVAAATTIAVMPATYEVKARDTLGEIADRLGVPLRTLVDANPGLIKQGQVLHLPVHTYEVCARDTLGAIATRFGVTLEALAAANAIANVNLVRVGQVLTIPR